MKALYIEYLKSTKWKRIRAEVVKRDNYKCVDCKVKVAEEVHHLHYRNIGNEKLEDLVSLCAPCHGKRHGITKEHTLYFNKYKEFEDVLNLPTHDDDEFDYEAMVEMEIERLNEKDDEYMFNKIMQIIPLFVKHPNHLKVF